MQLLNWNDKINLEILSLYNDKSKVTMINCESD